MCKMWFFKKISRIFSTVFIVFVVLVTQSSMTFADPGEEKFPSLVTITSSSLKPGNIFFEGETPSLSIQFSYKGKKSTDLNGFYKVLSYKGQKLAEGKINQIMEPDNIKKMDVEFEGIKAKGTYTIVVEAKTTDGRLDFYGEVPFSITMKAAIKSDGNIMGVCTHFGQGAGEPDTLLPLASDAGFGFIRDEYYWGKVEKSKGIYQFEYDDYIDIALSNGIQPLLILAYDNELYPEVGTDDFIAGFSNYCKALAGHLKGKVKYFEVWNEWNGGMGNPNMLGAAEYVKLLKAAYTAVKEVNPDAFIVGGASVLVDPGWVEQMLKAGGGQYMDAYSYHPYSSDPEGGAYVDNIKLIKNVLESNGFNGQAWVTEIGWSNENQEGGGTTELETAGYIVQMNVLTTANPGMVDKVFYYNLLNDGLDKLDGYSNFGLLSRDADCSAKLGYVAYSAYNNILANTKFIKSYSLKKDLRLYHFHRASDNKDILVAWSVGDIQAVGLNVGTKSLKEYDVMGNASTIQTVDKVLYHSISNVPIYLEGDFPEEITLKEAIFNIKEVNQKAVPGDILTISIDRTGKGKKIIGHYEVDIPDGWELLSDGNFNKSLQDTLKIKVPENLTRHSSDLNVYVIDKSSNKIASLQLKAENTDPFVVTVAPVPVDTTLWKQWELEVNLTNNNTTKTLPGGTMNILGPKAWIDDKEYSYREMKAGETQTIRIPLSTIDVSEPEEEPIIPISQGKPTSSQNQHAQGPPSNANDGNPKTGFCCEDGKVGYWWKLDLQDVYDLMGSEIRFEFERRVYQYYIETSKDDVNWELVADNTGNDKPLQTMRDLFDVQARYIRITCTGLEPGAWFAIMEYKAYDKAHPMPPIKEPPSKDLKLNIQPVNEGPIVIKKNVTFLAATYAHNKIVIDGNFERDEWDDAMAVEVNKSDHIQLIEDWKGPSDLSIIFKTKWDEDNLYLAVTVADDKHFQPYTGSSTWQADGLQIAIDPSRIYKPGVSGWSEIGFALNSDDKSIQNYRWSALPGKTAGVFNSGHSAIKRFMGQVTMYEIAIPWEEVLSEGKAAIPGTVIGFSMLANDNDGEKRRGWIEYMSGIGISKNPSAYGDLVLIDVNGNFVGKSVETMSTYESVLEIEQNNGLLIMYIIIGSSVILVLSAFVILVKKIKLQRRE